jgi:hypothetical protein
MKAGLDRERAPVSQIANNRTRRLLPLREQ